MNKISFMGIGMMAITILTLATHFINVITIHDFLFTILSGLSSIFFIVLGLFVKVEKR